MRMLATVARIGVGALCGFLLLAIMGHPMWDDGEGDLSELSSTNLATELLTDWSVAVIILGALLAMAMIGASYLIRDERLENLLWEQREDNE